MIAEDTVLGAASRRASRPSDFGSRAGSTGPFVPPTPSSPSIQVRGSSDFRAGIHRNRSAKPSLPRVVAWSPDRM
jgi:hypothetical protein